MIKTVFCVGAAMIALAVATVAADGKEAKAGGAAQAWGLRTGGDAMEMRGVEPALANLINAGVSRDLKAKDAKHLDPADAVQGAGGVVVVQRAMKELLQAAGTRGRYDVKVSPGIRGIVRDAFLPSDLPDMLAELSRTYDLVWYKKGKSVFVSSAAENASRIVYLGKVPFRRFMDSMAAAGLGNTGFQIEPLQEAQSVSLTGPVTFIANAELIADALVRSGTSRSIMVIRGGAVQEDTKTE